MKLCLIARTRCRGALWAVLAMAALSAGCSRSTPETAAAGGAVRDGERRFPLTGVIISVDTANKLLRVQHDEIKGLMPAMTMDFAVGDGDLAIAQKDRRIRAELVQRGNDFSLENIWPDDTAARAAVSAGAAALQQDTVIRGARAYREVGETVPDFTLFDQAGRVTQINRFRGKKIVLNFIFTRCPIPTMCPASTARMVALQKAAREAGVTNLELVSVTMDPAFDTPGVLRDYADAHGIDTANYSLLTGPEPAIRNLLTQMGVIAEFKDGLLRHTLATLLINEDGKIIWREDGSTWSPQVFLERMKP